MKTEYQYKGERVSIEIAPTRSERWRFILTIEDPPPGVHATTWGDVEQTSFPTEEDVLSHPQNYAEEQLDKADF